MTRRHTPGGGAVRIAGLTVALGAVCGTAAAVPALAQPATASASSANPSTASADRSTAMSHLPAAAAPVVLADGADASTASGTVLERIATYSSHLEEDPLYSDEASELLYGDAYDELRGLQEEAAVPTYIVFDQSLDYESTLTTAQILAETLSGDERVILVVGNSTTGPTVEAVAADEDRQRLLQQQFSYGRDLGADTGSVLARLRAGLEGLDDPQPIDYSGTDRSFIQELRYTLQYQISAFPLRTFAIAMLLVVGIAAILWFAIPRGARRKRYRIPKAVASAASAADRGAMRRALSDDALGIVDRLEKLQTDGLDADTATLVEHGLDAYGLARRIADDEDAREDDLAGAMVLMGIAESSVSHAESASKSRSGGRGSRKPAGGALSLRGRSAADVEQRLCSIDPRHGPAKRDLEVSVAGRTGKLTVPACAKCLHDDRSDNPLRWLTVGGKPYVLQDSVWAKTLYGGTSEDLVDAVVEARAKAT